MPRYFIDIGYRGAQYAGFQSQFNALTIQSVIENALAVIWRQKIIITGASRTDAGVHARQNFAHFDTILPPPKQFLYKINAVLPADIVINNIYPVPDQAHARFDAVSRTYQYYIYSKKDPFLQDIAYYFPYPLDMDTLQLAAAMLKSYTNFASFCKRNSQVKTYECHILNAGWNCDEKQICFTISANRFLRGMVRGLTGTMLLAGRGKMGLADFKAVIESKDCTRANFAVPARGLFLEQMSYPAGYFPGGNSTSE